MSRSNLLLLAFLACISAFSLAYAIRESRRTSDLSYARDQLRASLAEAQREIQTLSSRVSALTEATANASPERLLTMRSAQPAAPVRSRRAVVPAGVRPRRVEDERWKRVESRLAVQESQLAAQGERINQTEVNVQKAGDELTGRINSTRDELNGSIARTHEDVVLLQKRGEHNVYEFDLTRSKQFQRVGPLSLSLRKADSKHRSYDLSMMVDDSQLDKKHVNLFEPVWINLSDRPQPIQLVVNKIDKNQIRGYIIEARYKNTDLAGTPPSPPATPPAPALKQR